MGPGHRISLHPVDAIGRRHALDAIGHRHARTTSPATAGQVCENVVDLID